MNVNLLRKGGLLSPRTSVTHRLSTAVKNIHLLLWWILVTTLGWAAGWAAGLAMLWKGTEDDTLIFAIVGAGVGMMQWLVLRRHIPQAGWWVLASAVGWGVGGQYLEGLDQWALNDLGEGCILAFAIVGAGVGMMQWLVLRRRTPQAGWWVLASAVGWGVGWAGVGTATSGEESVIDIVIVALAMVGPVAGAITGYGLVQLLDIPWNAKAIHLTCSAAVVLSPFIVFLFYLIYPRTLGFIVLVALAHVLDPYVLAIRTKRYRPFFFLIGLVCSLIAVGVIYTGFVAFSRSANGMEILNEARWVVLILGCSLLFFVGLLVIERLINKGTLQRLAAWFNRLSCLLVVLTGVIGITGFYWGLVILCAFVAHGITLMLGTNIPLDVIGVIAAEIVMLEVFFWSVLRLLTRQTGWFHTLCSSCGKRVYLERLATRIYQCPECGQHFLTQRRRLIDDTLDYGGLYLGITITSDIIRFLKKWRLLR